MRGHFRKTENYIQDVGGQRTQQISGNSQHAIYLYTFTQSFMFSSLSSIPSLKSMVQHYPYFLTNDSVNNSKALLPVFITLFSSSPSAYNLACTTTCTQFPASVPIYFSFTTLTRDKLTKPLSKPNSAACKQTTLLFLFILIALVIFFLSIILFL